MVIEKNSRIVIVGAGVFGLSNALHLAQNGYTNIVVFDRLDFDSNHYTLLEGADTASADINKIFRAQYGAKKHYQDLAFQALEIWQKWDRDVKLLPKEETSKYTDLKILDMCGMLRLDDVVGWEEKASAANFAKDGISSLRYNINDPADVSRAKSCGLGPKVQIATDWKQNVYPKLEGCLDSTTGVLYASRALQYAAYLCRQMGVQFVLGGKKGTFKEYIYTDETKTTVGGIVTEDGAEHFSDLVVVNCGPWSTSLVPELDGINEATSGNVVVCKIPDDRSDLKIKYSAKYFPLVLWKGGHSREKEYLAGMYIFPIADPEGYIKIIVRQTKYTNPIKGEDGRVVSVPKTINSNPPFKFLTKHIVDQVKEWLSIFFPDLLGAGLKWESKIIWYTDTINNDYIYDFVPNRKGLFVACGGSGHAFKMLPVLGQFLVDKLENRENFYTKLFSWRYPKDFDKDPNGLKEGIDGPRAYDKQILTTDEDYIFESKIKSHL